MWVLWNTERLFSNKNLVLSVDIKALWYTKLFNSDNI